MEYEGRIAARYQENYEAGRRSKRRRTSQALNNVELQLNRAELSRRMRSGGGSLQRIPDAATSSCRRRPG